MKTEPTFSGIYRYQFKQSGQPLSPDKLAALSGDRDLSHDLLIRTADRLMPTGTTAIQGANLLDGDFYTLTDDAAQEDRSNWTDPWFDVERGQVLSEMGLPAGYSGAFPEAWMEETMKRAADASTLRYVQEHADRVQPINVELEEVGGKPRIASLDLQGSTSSWKKWVVNPALALWSRLSS